MEKQYRRVVPITPQDEMHLEVDHYLEPIPPPQPVSEEEIWSMATVEADKRYHQRNKMAHERFKLGYVAGAKANLSQPPPEKKVVDVEDIENAKEFRKVWQQQNPNTIHIPSEHELGLMEAYAKYCVSLYDSGKQEGE